MQPLLSICIPTYNRDKYLEESLKRLTSQINELTNPKEVELLVSDNCSTDNTQEIVGKIQSKNPYLIYNRNETNLGMDGNFIYCFQNAKGKYIWLLGDDDYLLPNSLNKILPILRNGDYGLLHLYFKGRNNLSEGKHQDPYEFLTQVSHSITFISINIVKKNNITSINLEKYRGTFFSILPPYIKSVLKAKENYLYREKVLDAGHNMERNGGYNFFEIFVKNYLKIWEECVVTDKNKNKFFKKEKRNLFIGLLFDWINILLVNKNVDNEYILKNSWKILFSHYWNEPYFYKYILKIYARKYIKRQ